MSILLLALLALWAFRTVRAVLWHVMLWQVKEYRYDRMRAHLALPSTRRAFFAPWQLGAWAVLLASFVLPTPLSVLITFLFFAEEALLTSWEIIQRTIARPRPTMRALMCSGGSLALLLGIAVAFWSQQPGMTAQLLLILHRITLIVVALSVAATHPLAKRGKNTRITRVARLIAARADLTVVGITGSMGKSSTKVFLTHLLEPDQPVRTTPSNTNTETGVADFILRSLTPEDRVLLVEMGAYRRGEIARLASLCRPRIGILTAIREQHLDLFGSRSALASAKGELLEALPADGVAIVNGDDPLCEAAARKTRARRIIRFGLGAESDVRAEEIVVQSNTLDFTLLADGDSARVHVPLLGAQQIPNLLAAVAAARTLGVPFIRLPERLAGLTPLPRTMELQHGRRGARVVDDSYTVNPDGVVAALEYFPHAREPRRIVVMTTMIELGPAARSAHRRVGDTLARVAPELVIITAPDFAADVMDAARERGFPADRFVVSASVPDILKRLDPILNPETIVLLEGRIPDELRRQVLAA